MKKKVKEKEPVDIKDIIASDVADYLKEKGWKEVEVKTNSVYIGPNSVIEVKNEGIAISFDLNSPVMFVANLLNDLKDQFGKKVSVYEPYIHLYNSDGFYTHTYWPQNGKVY